MIPEFAVNEWSTISPWREKVQDADFLGDTESMLRFGDTFDPQAAYELVREKLIDKLQK